MAALTTSGTAVEPDDDIIVAAYRSVDGRVPKVQLASVVCVVLVHGEIASVGLWDLERQPG